MLTHTKFACSKIWSEGGASWTPLYWGFQRIFHGDALSGKLWGSPEHGAQSPGSQPCCACESVPTLPELLAWPCVRCWTSLPSNFSIYKTREWAQHSDFTKIRIVEGEGNWRFVLALWGVSPWTGLLFMTLSLCSISVIKSSLPVSQSQSMSRLTFLGCIDRVEQLSPKLGEGRTFLLPT